MTLRLDETHDPNRKSWLPAANIPGIDFPIQNLPLGSFRRKKRAKQFLPGMAIGDRILDLSACAEAGFFTDGHPSLASLLAQGGIEPLSSLAAHGADLRISLRRQVSDLLKEGDGRIASLADWEERFLPLISECQLDLPLRIGDYTDFYASIHHATRVGKLFRPDQPLLPNYKHVPIGYHGRSSSIQKSGESIRRPSGQTKADAEEAPSFGPSRALDYEAEIGIYIGPGNHLGIPIASSMAEFHILGFCLLNDWSARDIQRWEYQPLGPFLAKNFATTVSPWIVTLEAMEPFRVPAAPRPAGDPAPLPYLDLGEEAARSGFNLTVEIALLTPTMREKGRQPFRVSRSNLRDLYWTPSQLVVHHASNGCNLRTGDLLGSGTISGPEDGSEGCLLERTRGGKEPLDLGHGETRKYLQDGDEVILTGFCEAPGAVRIGFGECRGVISPASKPL